MLDIFIVVHMKFYLISAPILVILNQDMCLQLAMF